MERASVLCPLRFPDARGLGGHHFHPVAGASAGRHRRGDERWPPAGLAARAGMPTRFAVAVQELFDQQVLGLTPAAVRRPPAYEQVHQQARSDPGPEWNSIQPYVAPAAAALIA